MIHTRTNRIRPMINSYTLECNECLTTHNFSGKDETEAESNAWKRGWNICRVGPSIAHYCKACAKKQLEKQVKAHG